MSLNLDTRQIAMLQEMGVRVWQPPAAAAPEAGSEPVTRSKALPVIAKPVGSAPSAIAAVASSPSNVGATGIFDSKKAPPAGTASAVTRVMPAASKPLVQPASTAASAANAVEQMLWGIGQPQLLYPPSGADSESAKAGARWLVLAEVPGEALQQALLQSALGFNAFADDAGRLLDNMLRAARLHQALSVHLLPVARNLHRPAKAASTVDAEAASANPIFLFSDLATAATALLEPIAPDLVLVMGRFAAQALLRTDLPLGKLRGQVHAVGGRPAIVMLDAGYLLRNQAYKANAWEDLRLAMAVAGRVGG